MTAVGVLFVHTASVRRYAGAGQEGDLYDTAVTMPCFIEDNIQEVRSPSGEIVTSTTTVYAPLEYVGLCVPKSIVTVWGRPARVISQGHHEAGVAFAPVEHCSIHLT